jgi:hypothetical protein
LDNLPIFTFIKLATDFPNITAKLRPTRYIDRDTTYFIRIPKEISKDVKVRKEYERIQFKSIGNYRDIYRSKIENGKKYAHWLLPLGVQNRAAISLNLKENITLINRLLCSDLVVENQLGDMFERFLIPEIKINPNSQLRVVMSDVVEYLSELVSKKQSFNEDRDLEFTFQYVDDLVEHLITNFERLINPLGSKDELEFDYNDQVYIGKLIRKANLGTILKSKGAFLGGYLSLNELLRISEKRHLMYIPLLYDFIDIDKELDRTNSNCYLLPRDIDKNSDLGKEFNKLLSEIYGDIKKWRKNSLQHMSEEVSKEYTRYLLPLAHMTRFNLYLDVEDIFSVKEGDYEYKEEWSKLFYQRDPVFKK